MYTKSHPTGSELCQRKFRRVKAALVFPLSGEIISDQWLTRTEVACHEANQSTFLGHPVFAKDVVSLHLLACSVFGGVQNKQTKTIHFPFKQTCYPIS